MNRETLAIGIDLGGTKVATGLVNSQGRLLREDRRPSKSPEYPRQSPKQQIRFVVESMADAVFDLVRPRPGKTLKQKVAKIQGVGLAAAGPLSVDKGLIVHPSNFAGWGVVPIVRLLGEALRKRQIPLPVHFQNDAIAAALGEGWIGRAKNSVSYAMITLGTGIGTGVIFNGRPAQSRGMGSEWGHILIDHEFAIAHAKDFYHASVEGLASGTGMFQRAKAMHLPVSSMVELAALARTGDERARHIFAQAGHALALLFYNLSVGFHLDKFCVTGGLLPIRDLFLPAAIERYRMMIHQTHPTFRAPIVISKVGNRAGVIGAARLVYLDN